MAPVISAVLFDVDGTLYHQPPLRAAMACELAMAQLRGPREGRRIVKVLRAFRAVREELRAVGRPDARLDELQFTMTADRTRVDAAAVRAIVDEWILTRPLRHLVRFRRPGLRAALAALKRSSIRAGVFSDYPADTKLDALGIAGAISVRLCATDPDVNAFKPHPRGLIAASQRWGLSPHEVVYVGDRPDVDAAGAAAAGMPCVIIGRRAGDAGTPFVRIASMSDLGGALDSLDSPAEPAAAALGNS